ncbi:MAG: response regulator [Opitutales bacterium]|nr:response regulator [Opitutales bacterium]
MKRVLIVDDKEENLYYLSALLQGHGYSVLTALNGAEALQKARHDRPDLIVSDLLMPVMDGYTLLRNWKSDADLRAIPFIVYTATYTEQDDRKLAMDMGADGFILKPCEPEDFIQQTQTVVTQANSASVAIPRNPVVEEDRIYKSYSESLIRKLEDKTLELEAANRRLAADLIAREKLEQQLLRAQRMESIGALAGGVAHDLNNLLSPILMGVGFSRKFDLPEPVLQVMQTIEDSAQRGSALVRQVLSFARGDDGEPRKPLDLSAVLADMKPMIEKTFPQAIRFKLECEEALPPILANPTQLSQVVLNLCFNARDAMADGGELKLTLGQIELAEADRRERPARGTAFAGSYLCLEVQDSGCGIDPVSLEQIFEPFFTTKAADKGTGLGLPTVAGIVCNHGGFVDVESQLGQGTTFKVYLPIAADKSEPSYRSSLLDGLPLGGGECVLVAESEASVRGITSQMLESFGYRVLSSETGLEALALFREKVSEVDVVVADLKVVALDGLALVRTLKALKPSLQLIVTGENATSKLSGQPEAKNALNKPYTAKQLLLRLREVL